LNYANNFSLGCVLCNLLIIKVRRWANEIKSFTKTQINN
jgi:hypothetical protein